MKKYLIQSVVAAGVVGLAVGGFAFAHGPWGVGEGEKPMSNGEGFEAMLERKAEVLGISVEDLKDAKEEGMNFREIAEEQGWTAEDFYLKMQTQLEVHLQELVDQGKITQEQADQKLEWMQEKHNNGDCHEEGFGFGRGMIKRGWNKTD